MATQVSRGSTWHRWDPHVHVPGTVLNDQFGNAPGTWESFLIRVEKAIPTVEALGVTDYYSLSGYKRVCASKKAGRLRDVGLVFPNVEIRLAIGTSKGGAVNAHLLFSPDDPDHIAQIESFLGKLIFRSADETYACTEHDVMRLGRRHKSESLSNADAFAAGATQFKVELEQLKTLWKGSAWIAENCLFAVAAGERDGTSGIRADDDSLETLRKSVEHFASIVFSSSSSQIEFWLGKRKASINDLETKWGGLKPCLHGSDSHAIDQVAAPAQNRFCWLKCDLTFEALKHVCIEPEARVFIGESPPGGAGSHSRTIESISALNSPWMQPQSVPLNSGLIAIIGARGSGKTALADLIAAGGLEVSAQHNKNSFLVRAKEHLGQSSVRLTWADADTSSSSLVATEINAHPDTPRVQYLSQQFVDRLCSADGNGAELKEEIQRVLFVAHAIEEREGTSSFDELLQLRLEPARARRSTFVGMLDAAIEALNIERQVKTDLPQVEKQKAEQAKLIRQDEFDRNALLVKGEEQRGKRFQAVQEALETRRRQLEQIQEQIRALKSLAQDVESFRNVQAPAITSRWKETRVSAAISNPEWELFSLCFHGDVDTFLKNKIAAAEASCKAVAGTPIQTDPAQQSAQPHFLPDAKLLDQSVALLSAEIDRLGRLIGVDKQNSKRSAQLGDRILKAKKAVETLDLRISKALTADERIKGHVEARKSAYRGTFQAIADLEVEYRNLYAPLGRSLNTATGSLAKLGVVVRRIIDIDGWAEKGELLLDLRKQGSFRGKGALLLAARDSLLASWQGGSADEVAVAMHQFVENRETTIREHRPEGVDPREWAASISAWLYDTSHISVAYALTYDGVEIERLSPGTRGVVLLLLYLTIDQEDDRPLIVDQPEENLDPKSVYDELVQQFRRARQRRQVIIVTHNANLVVNTDADQVIVAEASGHAPGKLPEIRYLTGGLEDRLIRKHVCDVLEGGEQAFRDRARRLRLKLGVSSPTDAGIT
jgi:AAA domain, putative AbiEii toxin, Type IV TA system